LPKECKAKNLHGCSYLNQTKPVCTPMIAIFCYTFFHPSHRGRRSSWPRHWRIKQLHF